MVPALPDAWRLESLQWSVGTEVKTGNPQCGRHVGHATGARVERSVLRVVCPATTSSGTAALPMLARVPEASTKKQIDVVGAVIVRDGLVLSAQRGRGSLAGRWEFPGGKIESGETARAALEREILEELECEIQVGDEVTSTTHEYDFGVVTLTTFLCTLISGTPKLTEHTDIVWLPAGELAGLDWAPADLPAVEIICDVLG
ncbi:hypothetical protein GCM10011575_06480 [Microlunatus endophyticus]|uniref:8-oxo-dGTP diphosphatase n=1 Tax=Microlunatus endophyticus TaxID=1716077 RepID=A0A917W1F2_9ACTN|nr:hypothetical protein GCM10011575_06480 [Microlunatus endophyticus]